jgi:PEP-CTERM motif
MRKLTATLALAILTALPATLLADPVPYANIGQVAPTTLITASETGDIIGYFVQASAAHTDTVRMLDVTTGYTSAWFFPNQTTAVGTAADFGFVSAGDALVFEINDVTTNNIYANNPTYSDDGVNHAYITPFAGGTLYGQAQPSGIYVGMEDLTARVSDFDYNDDTFLFTNNASKSSTFNKTSSFSRTLVQTTTTTPDPTPEPSTLLLLGTGMLCLAGALRGRVYGNRDN